MLPLRITAAVSIFLFLISGTGLAKDYNDLRNDSSAALGLQRMEAAGFPYFDGFYPGKNLQPGKTVSRAEFTLIALRAGLRGETASVDPRCFKDFTGPLRAEWQPACAAKMSDIVEGYGDGSFRARQTITLAEALKIATRALDVPVPVYVSAPDHWYDPYMEAGMNARIFGALPKKPHHPMTRKDVILMISQLFPRGIRCSANAECMKNTVCEMSSGYCAW